MRGKRVGRSENNTVNYSSIILKKFSEIRQSSDIFLSNRPQFHVGFAYDSLYVIKIIVMRQR